VGNFRASHLSDEALVTELKIAVKSAKSEATPLRPMEHMNYQTILYEVKDGAGRLTLNRPEKLNSFNEQMHEEVRDVLSKIETEPVRALLITGAGRGFCAGQDLGDRRIAPGNSSIDLGTTIEKYYAPLVRALRALPIPVVAGVNGVAAGAGANLAFACDLVIAAKSASFIESFARLGLVPDTGGTYFLPRLVGTARALGLAMLGDKVSAEQAAAWGLIWRCVDDGDFPAAINQLMTQLALAPTKGLASTKQAIYASHTNSLDTQLDLERDLIRELGRSRDYQEGVAAFLEKRTPRFTGE
jgi:2-(1,2-epoxy-1,2-dihydrophenyl)acetyl-CoA isomerase